MLKISKQEQIKRIISGIAIVLITIYSLTNKFFFGLYLLLIFAMMVFEWIKICNATKKDSVIGILLITTSIISLFLIHQFSAGKYLLIWYFLIIWCFDSFALIGGKLIGGEKLALKVSPQKTWSGFFVGLLFATIFASIYEQFLPKEFFLYKLFSTRTILPIILIASLAQVGDLIESYFKRKYSVKDSGFIIPGHGGFLDRYDSILISAPIFLILLLFI